VLARLAMTWNPSQGERRRVERKSREMIEQWLRDLNPSTRGFKKEVEALLHRAAAKPCPSGSNEKTSEPEH
jgi:hypothetical protein